MSNKIKFSVQKRNIIGKQVAALRRDKQLPGSVYGKGLESVAIQFDKKAFETLFKKVGETGLLYLSLEEETKDRPVLVDEVQYDPVSDVLLHVSFKQVNLSEKIKAEVPVVFEGENTVVGGVIVKLHTTVEVEALPEDLPESFVVNIGSLETLGQNITFADLEYDKEKVTLVIGEEHLQEPVVMLQEMKEEKEEEAAPVEETAAIVGETPAAPVEGEAAAPKAEEPKKE